MNQLIVYEAVSRTAPAIPGLLDISTFILSPSFSSWYTALNKIIKFKVKIIFFYAKWICESGADYFAICKDIVWYSENN